MIEEASLTPDTGATTSEGVSVAEVLVGVDDSPSGRAALVWAARYARGINAPLLAVHVLRPPGADQPMVWAAGLGAAALNIDESADALVRSNIESLFVALGPEPGWRLEFVVGTPGRVMVERARRAQILVLGTRDHVGVERILVGSVSHYCLSHAACPIVAVPAPVAVSGAALAGHRS